MSDSTELILSDVVITPEEFYEFVRSFGDRYQLRVNAGPHGKIYDAFIILAPGHNISIIFNRPRYVSTERIAAIQQRVGVPIRTVVLIDRSKTPITRKVTNDLEVAFADRWPCFVDNLMPGDLREFYTAQELPQVRDHYLEIAHDELEAAYAKIHAEEDKQQT